MGILNSEEDRLRKRLASVEDELAQFRNGYKGACYACEYVGEKNVQLEDEITSLKADIERHIQIAAQLEAQLAAERERVERLRGSIKNALLYFRFGSLYDGEMLLIRALEDTKKERNE